MKIFKQLSLLATGMLLAACTAENVIDEPVIQPGGKDDANTREVTLLLKNKLSTASRATTKADDPIATAEENYIRSLDVYVFGSPTENGTYTFQELYYYRDDATTLPAEGEWAHSFSLSPTSEDNTTTALLKLNKGLFVKVYCIANRDELCRTDAATKAIAAYTDFTPLTQTKPGQPDNAVTPGVPTEAEFLALHTRAINPATTGDVSENDVLQTPLPMVGSYTTPLDLTDFSISARTQISFKLSRMVARFDIINDAGLSKFTIEEISMGNGRKGASFFPIKVLSDTKDGEDLISYPARTLTAETQKTAPLNETKGAFYTWPSLQEDQGFLTLKGKYAVNKTELMDVSYQIPFKQVNNGIGSYIEVSNNHRYTIAITAADRYELDFTLKISDWADEDGEINNYEPENDFDSEKIALSNDPAYASVETYVTQDGTVEVLPAAGSKFAFDMGANTELNEEIVYENDVKWLVADTRPDPVVTKAGMAAFTQTYTYKLDETLLAEAGQWKPVTIRLTNPASGNVKDIRVIPTPGPALSLAASYSGFAKFDPKTLVATVYNAAGQTIKLHAVAETRKDASDVETTGSSVDVANATGFSADQASAATAEADYTLTLGAAQSAPADYAGYYTFASTASKGVSKVTVKLKNPAITMPTAANFHSDRADNTFEATAGTGGIPRVVLMGAEGNSFTLLVESPEGVNASVSGGEDWLEAETHEKTTANGMNQCTLTGRIVAGAVFTADKTDGKITLTNRIDNSTLELEVTGKKITDPTVTLKTVTGNFNTYADPTATLYNLAGQQITLSTDLDVTVSSPAAWLSVTSASPKEHTLRIQSAQASASATATVTFTTASGGKKEVTVALKDAALAAPVAADFTAGTGSNVFTEAAAGANASIVLAEATTASACSLAITSPEGVTVSLDDAARTWLAATASDTDNGDGTHTTTLSLKIADGHTPDGSETGAMKIVNTLSGAQEMTIDVSATVTPAP